MPKQRKPPQPKSGSGKPGLPATLPLPAPTTTPIASVPIRVVLPEAFPLTFANHASIQWTDSEFILSFFQVAAPVGTREEVARMESVSAYPVSRIVLTPPAARNSFQRRRRVSGLLQD